MTPYERGDGTLKTEETRCFSVAETAQILGICKAKVYALVRDDIIPNLRIGRRIVIPADSLREWMQTEAEGVVTVCPQ